MATATRPLSTLGDVLRHLPYIPASRIRIAPAPGTATAADALQIAASEGVACEVYDGILVEKAMGYYESWLAMVLAIEIGTYLKQNDLGILTGEQGPLWVDDEQMRMPDLAFFPWSKFPNRVLPEHTILDHVPDLAVEVLSSGNTLGEMERKRREYFAGGAALVWEIQPQYRTATVYTAFDRFVELRNGDRLDGGAVLPGFAFALTTLFDRAERGLGSAP